MGAASPAPSAQQAPGELTPRLDAARSAYKARRFQDAHREIAAALALVHADRARQAEALAAMPPPARFRAGIEVPQPERTRNVPPRFPIEALRAGVAGFVAVEAVIDERGRVTDAKVVRSVRELDRAALSAVREWRFTPTVKDGKPAEVVALFLTNFTARTSPQVLDDVDFGAFYHAHEHYLLAGVALARALGTVNSEVASCSDAIPVGSAPPAGADPAKPAPTLIQEPVKIKDVRPVYPAVMQDVMRGAKVTLEAVIDKQGAVTCLHVREGDPFFDQSAIDAVKQWAFKPTLADGVPVAVVMTVTVTYSVTR